MRIAAHRLLHAGHPMDLHIPPFRQNCLLARGSTLVLEQCWGCQACKRTGYHKCKALPQSLSQVASPALGMQHHGWIREYEFWGLHWVACCAGKAWMHLLVHIIQIDCIKQARKWREVWRVREEAWSQKSVSQQAFRKSLVWLRTAHYHASR